MRRRFSTCAQISVSLVSITVTLLMLANMIGLIPKESVGKTQSRLALLRTVATQTSLAAQTGDSQLLKASLESALLTVPDLVGCEIETDGRQQQVGVAPADHSTPFEMQLYLGNEKRGILRFHFQDPAPGIFRSIVPSSLFPRFVVFIAGLQLAFCWLYLRYVLYHLDPSRIVPERVTKTLDALAEGLVVLDRDERIVLANRAVLPDHWQVSGRPDWAGSLLASMGRRETLGPGGTPLDQVVTRWHDSNGERAATVRRRTRNAYLSSEHGAVVGRAANAAVRWPALTM